MKFISALGGSGSTFIIRALDKRNYTGRLGWLNPERIRQTRLSHYRYFGRVTDSFLISVRAYHPKIKVLVRPDVFWTERYNKTGVYDPKNPKFSQDLKEFADFIVRTRMTRSAGIEIQRDKLNCKSHNSLVRSYINIVEEAERSWDFKAVLLAGHWGEYEILRNIGVKTIYLIRDPYNSIISHSKSERHEENYYRRGLTDINSRAWIDAYLFDPIHRWINHARTALADHNGTIVRYDKFHSDWHSLTGFPDISKDFVYKSNAIREIFSQNSIDYIYSKTHAICKELDLIIPGLS